jgi:hypothetical protein
VKSYAEAENLKIYVMKFIERGVRNFWGNLMWVKLIWVKKKSPKSKMKIEIHENAKSD